jgi:hypothetical protein
MQIYWRGNTNMTIERQKPDKTAGQILRRLLGVYLAVMVLLTVVIHFIR